jgi:hypothetical protein
VSHRLLIPGMITFGLRIFGLQFQCLILPLLIVAPCLLMPLYSRWVFLVFLFVVVAHLGTSVFGCRSNNKFNNRCWGQCWFVICKHNGSACLSVCHKEEEIMSTIMV